MASDLLANTHGLSPYSFLTLRATKTLLMRSNYCQITVPVT